jgi:hypothetical protein
VLTADAIVQNCLYRNFLWNELKTADDKFCEKKDKKVFSDRRHPDSGFLYTVE